jgi:hypothetical protein
MQKSSGQAIHKLPAAQLVQAQSACFDPLVLGGATQAAGQIRQAHVTTITREESRQSREGGDTARPARRARSRALCRIGARCSGLAHTAERAWVAAA